ncbi:MAG: 3-isopropylmalate dehydratase [Ignavibacteria bacterium GWA2_35_9]|nr:MAG: 3-isopropylmalate dehydratase [Ignavibacteria bacterium GWA2_35_9]OGU45196.1 MAG: 3-isopropylmalate dehydratase [Ignavibacteria bacterium GWB2_36_8]OGU48222.1 MAG: 3-isopropylmalate dehydratase [Ignavibacteria bacterium GWC2_36_12]
MEKSIKGKAFVLGNNIDTDQIIPAEHLVYSLNDPKESQLYGRYALSGVPLSEAGLPGGNIPFIKGEETVSEYSIVIGGSNFGCGSSREHAPFALMKAGVKAVIAESYARIYYRNSVDGGFLIPYEAKEKLNNVISTNDEVEIIIDENMLINHTTKKEYSLNPLGDILPIIEAGNLFEYARKSGMIV